MLSTSLAALMAVGAFAAPSPLAPAAVTATPAQRAPEKALAPTPAVSPALIQRALGSGVYLLSARTSPIWLGSPKRGARRHRSRWNYRR